MKIKFNIIYAILGIVFLTASCSKDFLDKPVYGVLAAEDYFQTEEELQEGVFACYDVLQWAYAPDWNSVYMVKTLPSDETHAGGGSDADQPPYQQLDDYSFTSENKPIEHTFKAMYFGIARANAIINIATPDNQNKTQLIAEAKALRAYFYFELVSMFGKVPLMLELPTSAEEYAQAGAPIADLYAQIHKDLDEAIQDLPKKSQYSDAMKFRMSKGTAEAIKGKAFLYEGKYAEAATAFEEVIGSGEYALQADYSTLFLKESEYGVESLFEVGYVSTEGYDWGTFQWGGNRAMENNIHFQLMGPRGEYFNAGTSGMIGGWGFNYPTATVYQAFVDAGDIVRKNASVISLNDLETLYGGEWTAAPGTVWGMEGYFRVKYGTMESETNGEDGAVKELNYGTNIRLLRYADVLLMAAEANIMAGNAAVAQPYLDEVRTRAGLASVTATMEAIKTERQLELSFEGVRYFDLIRWGDASNVLSDQGFSKNGNFFQGKHELFPIPYAELSNNPLIEQNPNW